MRRIRLFLLFACFALVLGACAVDLAKAVVGKYRGELDLSGVKTKDRPMAEQGAKMLSGATLEIKDGGKATLAMGAMSEEATWKLEDKTLSISPKRGGNTLKFTVQDGAKKLDSVMTDDEAKMFLGAKFRFKKE